MIAGVVENRVILLKTIFIVVLTPEPFNIYFQMKDKFIFPLAVTAMLLLLIYAYANHFSNGFHFDDSHTIQNNIYITSIKNIPLFFKDSKTFSSIPSHQGYRPGVTTTLAIDYWLGGGLNKTFYFHLSTFIWYIALCVLFFFLVFRLLNVSKKHKWNKYIALFTVGLFSVHTVNAETINYIISRSDVLSTLCILISFVVFIFLPKKRKWFLYIIPLVIGLFFKETILVFAPILFVYIILFEKNMSLLDIFRIKHLKTSLITFAVVLPALLVALLFQVYTLSMAKQIELTNSPLYYVMTQPFVMFHYFTSFFLPFNLSADTDWGVITNPFDDRLIAGVIFIITTLVIAFRCSKKKEMKPISFGIVWFIIALLPTSIIPLSEVMNDHRMFFPYLGLTLSLCWAAGLMILRYEEKINNNIIYRFFILISASVLIFAHVYGTRQRNKVWKTEETLWRDVTVKSPLNGRGWMNYGLTQMGQGKYDLALNCFETSLKYCPYYSSLHVNLGIVKNAMGKTAEAEAYFLKGIQYGPNDVSPYYYYGRFLKENKRDNEAVPMLKKALEFNYSFMDARYLLMEIYADRGNWDELNTLASQTLEISPENKFAKTYLEASLNKVTNLDIAVSDAKKKNSPEAYLNLSLTLYQRGKFRECISACNDAIKRKPLFPEAYNNICSAYNALSEWDNAIKACNKAIELKPDFQLAKNNRNWALSQKQNNK